MTLLGTAVLLLASACAPREGSRTSESSASPASQTPAATAADGTDARACRDGRCHSNHRGTGTQGFSLWSGSGS